MNGNLSFPPHASSNNNVKASEFYKQHSFVEGLATGKPATQVSYHPSGYGEDALQGKGPCLAQLWGLSFAKASKSLGLTEPKARALYWEAQSLPSARYMEKQQNYRIYDQWYNTTLPFAWQERKEKRAVAYHGSVGRQGATHTPAVAQRRDTAINGLCLQSSHRNPTKPTSFPCFGLKLAEKLICQVLTNACWLTSIKDIAAPMPASSQIVS